MIKKLSIFFSMVLVACNPVEDNCVQFADIQLKAFFYDLEEGKQTATAIDNISLFYLERPDTLIYDRVDNLREIILEPNPTKDETAFVLQVGLVRDTIRLQYERELMLLSFDCGFTTTFNLTQLRATGLLVDSLGIVNSQVTTEDENEHIRIYF